MRWSTWTWVVGLVLWASGAVAQLSPLEQVRDVRFHAGVAGTATGNTFTVSGWTSIGIQVTGITTATVDFRATIDGTNYVAFPCVNAAGSIVSSTTGNGLFTCAIGQFKKVRAPISSHSSGTVVVTGVLSTAVARGSGGGGGSSLTVKENDDNPSVSGVSSISFTNGTVTDDGGGAVSVAISGTGAPTDATYITQTANGTLSNEQALGANATGCMGSATTTGIVSSRTMTGTANEIDVTNGNCSGNPTFALSATIDLGGKTSFEVPNGASPTTDAFGELAGDNNAWDTGRGALQFFDGTANTYILGALASDTPSNGQVPTWNTDGTITWESVAGTGDVTAASAFGTDNVLIKSDGTGKGVQATGISVADTTNIISGSDAITFGSNPGDAGRVRLSNNESICWEAATPGTDLCITLNASDEFELNAPLNITGTAGPLLLTGVATPSAPAGAEQWYFYADSADNLPKYIYNGGSEQTFYTTGNPQTTVSGNAGTATALAANGSNCSAGSYPLGVDASGASESCTSVASDTVAFTNKTVDCTAASNVCTIYKYMQLDLVGVAGGTAGHVWDDDPLSTTCTAASTAGTNQTRAFCTFPDSDGEYGKQLKLSLPTGYVAGTLQFRVSWKTTGTGNFRPRLQTLCYASDAASDTAYSNSTYITAAAGTSARFNQTAWTTATDTGCDAEETMAIRFSRNRTEASDTLNSTADVEFVGVRYAVAQ